MSEIVYLNGEFMPLAEARIPVLDRGFIFGDGVYEVIPVYSRNPFRLPEHLARFRRSHEAIRLENPFSNEEWTGLVDELVASNSGDDQSIYLQVTRGVAKRDHAFPEHVTPTVFGMSSPLSTPSRDAIDNGVAAITAADFRWLKCDVKSTSLLGNCLLRQAAADAGALEVVMFRDGFLTEGSSSNVFVVKNGVILGPAKDNLVLPGITYNVVVELAQNHGLPHNIGRVSEQTVREAEEIWVTSSTKEVLAVTTLGGKPVGSGKPGPVFRRMHQLYQEFKRTVMRQAA